MSTPSRRTFTDPTCRPDPPHYELFRTRWDIQQPESRADMRGFSHLYVDYQAEDVP